MLSLSYIQAGSQKAALESAREKKHPAPIWPEDIQTFGAFRRFCSGVPFLGGHEEGTWKKVNVQTFFPEYHYSVFFVDSSGLGDEGEAALTLEQFRKMLLTLCERHGSKFGLGILEAGQFQVNISLYEQRKKGG